MGCCTTPPFASQGGTKQPIRVLEQILGSRLCLIVISVWDWKYRFHHHHPLVCLPETYGATSRDNSLMVALPDAPPPPSPSLPPLCPSCITLHSLPPTRSGCVQVLRLVNLEVRNPPSVRMDGCAAPPSLRHGKSTNEMDWTARVQSHAIRGHRCQG